MLRIRAPKDFAAGLIFVGFGALALVVGRDYSVGSTLRMGPGYFPLVLGVCLVVIGSATAAGALVVDGPAVGRVAVRPLLMVLGALVAFGLVLEPLGLVAAVVIVALVSGLGSHECRLREVIWLALLLALFSYAVFVYALGLPFDVWPEAAG